jgi:methylmalonyl-CoA decarboxylase
MTIVDVDAVGDHVVVVTMADAPRRNTLSAAMLAQLEAALTSAGAMGARAVVLRAAADATTWCAGFDIDALPAEVPAHWEHPMDRLLARVADAPFPVIAAVHGGVWGGGFELVLACDLVVATRSATFAITPARLGVAYGTEGVSRFLAALPVKLVNELFFTADPVSADRLERAGLVNRVVGDVEEMAGTAVDLAARIAERAPLTVRSIKAEIAALASASARAAEGDPRLQQLRRQAWESSDYQEGRRAFREKRAPEFRGQ